MRRVLLPVVLAAFILVLPSHSNAQERGDRSAAPASPKGGGYWDNRFGPPTAGNGTNSIVLNFAVDDTTGDLYAGGSFSKAIVGSNGTLGFRVNANPAANACLPSGDFSWAILLHWDDLRTTLILAGEGIYTSVSGEAP